MKRIVLSWIVLMISISSFSQKKVTVRGGTIIQLEAVNNVKGRTAKIGDLVDFAVTTDLMVDGYCVIPKGKMVKGKVFEAKKSSIAGTKGRLGIHISRIILDNGESLFFSDSDVRIQGKNRTPLAVVTCLFVWPCIFIPGSKAEMPVGYTVDAMVSSNTEITVE